MPRTFHIPLFLTVLLFAVACGGGEWVGEEAGGLESSAWPGNLAGAWRQEIPGCPGALRRWDFFPPETFVETVDDPFSCVGAAGEWYGGMNAYASQLLDLTSEGPDVFRRMQVALDADGLNTRAFADEGESRCFFSHRWRTHLAEDFFDRRFGLRLCFSRALSAGGRPVTVEMQVWLYEDAGTDALAATGHWSWTLALQNRFDEQGGMHLWPEGMAEEDLARDWQIFLDGQAGSTARLAQALGQESLPRWLWRDGRLVEDAPAAWWARVE